MGGEAFSYRDGRAAGLSPEVLRGPTYEKPFRGVRTSGELDLPRRLQAATILLPEGAALTGWAGLVARGIPPDWLDGRDRNLRPMPIRIEVPPGTQSRHRDGLDVIRRDDPVEWTWVDGAPVATAPVCWLTEIGRANNQVVALILTDAVLRFGLATEDELAQHAGRSSGARGVRLARWALANADPYAESPPESEYRLRWLQTGCGRPLANRVILDEYGRFIARVDLLDEEAWVAGEFNGAWHRLGVQPWHDEIRLRDVRRVGVEVAVVGGPDLHNQGAGARAAVVETYALARQRPASARRWRVGPPPPLPYLRRE